VEQYSQQLEEAQADLAAVAQSITEGNVRLTGLQGEIDRFHREIQALGAVNLAALDELTAARERKTFLDAGVQVLAQPPGKKNQTIHLLSGGEKALTAIALVFAIFQPNPAPFCLLDEVDAPLDDANTERYSRLVTSMSKQGTQFLFISHNKIAMEMAEQLIGVTMQEQGVSRIVAVDMESAAGMLESV
jgi:chromosome segregation ATPase